MGRDSLGGRYVLRRTLDELGVTVVDFIYLVLVAVQCWAYVNTVLNLHVP